MHRGVAAGCCRGERVGVPVVDDADLRARGRGARHESRRALGAHHGARAARRIQPSQPREQTPAELAVRAGDEDGRSAGHVISQHTREGRVLPARGPRGR